MLFALSSLISEQQEQIQWVSWLQLLAPFTGKQWIPQDHIPPRCEIPWWPTQVIHSENMARASYRFEGWRGCVLLIFMQKSDKFTNSFLDTFHCVYLQKQQHLIMCWGAACFLVNWEIIFGCILWVFFSLRNWRCPRSKYPDISIYGVLLTCFLGTQKSLLSLLTLVGRSQWC